MASRSTVSTPVALASAAAWFASGERMELAGIEFGSETMFMPRLYAAEQGGSTMLAGSVRSIWQCFRIGKIGESRKSPIEMYWDGSGGAVSLFRNNYFGLASVRGYLSLPLDM